MFYGVLRPSLDKLQKLWFSCKEIGIPQMADFAGYLIQKKTGRLIKTNPLGGFELDFNPKEITYSFPFDPFNKQLKELIDKDRDSIIQSADEIMEGWYHPFGGEKAPLTFSTGIDNAVHWSEVGDQINGRDIKWLWEPARFSWAIILAKAWMVTRDDRYVHFYWQKFYEFVSHNPINSAPNWTSAQEAAIRIMIWLLCHQIFKESPATTPENTLQLTTAIWHHASRIPSTLAYARSQNNNHLLSEALGLVIAGGLFSEKSNKAKKWLQTGINEFNQGILNQIEADGTYSQHSANYHRLMIHLALIFTGYAKFIGVEIPVEVKNRLAAATRWMAAQMDPISGRLPNLGHNDGALLLSQGAAEFRDYRPTLQAASLAYLDQPCLPAGPWDELALWLGMSNVSKAPRLQTISSPAIQSLEKDEIKTILRGVTFHGRPAHADQLHLEIWWDGFNITQDSGTFSYNDNPPWQNPFSTTLVHNTLSIDGKDQMQKASKFLWLRQAQAKWINAPSKDILMAAHNGYNRLGVTVKRIVSFIKNNELEVVDQVIHLRKSNPRHVTLHWLLPDWEWQWQNQLLTLNSGFHQVQVNIHANVINETQDILPDDISLIRAGETLMGNTKNTIMGWASDTYSEKHPALSLSIQYQSNTNLQIVTRFIFSKNVVDSQG